MGKYYDGPAVMRVELLSCSLNSICTACSSYCLYSESDKVYDYFLYPLDKRRQFFLSTVKDLTLFYIKLIK